MKLHMRSFKFLSLSLHSCINFLRNAQMQCGIYIENQLKLLRAKNNENIQNLMFHTQTLNFDKTTASYDSPASNRVQIVHEIMDILANQNIVQ